MGTTHERRRRGAAARRSEQQDDGRPAAPVPADAVLRLQRGVGNHAVTRMLVQRKHDDLPEDEKADRKLADQVRKYNATRRIDDIADPLERATRRNQDDIMLNLLLSLAYDLPDTDYVKRIRTVATQHLEAVQQATTQADRAQHGAKAKIEWPTAPLTFRSPFPRGGLEVPPKKGDRPFTGVEYMLVTIEGKAHRLYAGQIFLNPRQSIGYKADPSELKGENVPIFRQETEEGLIAVLGDHHHRFVWSAFHGIPITAELKPGWTNPKQWAEIVYSLHPKNEYEFIPDSPLTRELELALASRLPKYLDLTPAASQDVLVKHVRLAKTNSDAYVDPEELPPLVEHLAHVRWEPYEEFVHRQVSAAANQAHAQAMAKILLHSFPSGHLPAILLGRTPSEGYYDSLRNVIVLDPKKNPTPDALLDTLAYESGNAMRRADFLKNAKFVTQIEFEVTDSYVRMLMEATHTGGINTLVSVLGIPEALTDTLADATRSLSAKKLLSSDGKLLLPPKSVLNEQYKRTALTFFLQQAWPTELRQKYFASTEHAEGMQATGAGYESAASIKGATTWVDTAIKGKARPCLRPVVLAMAAAYPNATQQHFSALTPRQIGSFLVTGRVESWEVAEGPDALQKDLMVEVIRDLGEVYPNRSAWEPRVKDLTFADFGEFLLYGKIRLWEDRELLLAT